MSKWSLAEMSEDELLAEIRAWENLINTPKGPGSASNGERNAAYMLKDMAGAWLVRRQSERKAAEEPKR